MKIIKNKISWLVIMVMFATTALIYFCSNDYLIYGSFENHSFSHGCEISNSGLAGGADCLTSHLSLVNQITGIFTLDGLFLLLILSSTIFLIARFVTIKMDKSGVVLKYLFERYKIEVRTTIESRLRYYLALFNHI